MNVSYNWLKRYLDTDLSAERMAEILTELGLEVEEFEKDNGTIKAGVNGKKTLIYPPSVDVDILEITDEEYKACTPLENYIVQDGKLVLRPEILEEGES